MTPHSAPASRPDDAPATIGDLKALRTEVLGEVAQVRSEVALLRGEVGDLRGSVATAIRDSENRTMAAIRGVEERARDSEKRLMAAIENSEKRLMAAIATAVKQSGERVDRSEVRQRWWNRLILLPYAAALVEAVRRIVGRLFF